MSRHQASFSVGTSSTGKVGLESEERTNVADKRLPEQQRPCSHRNRVEDKPCDRCHRARPAGARPAGKLVTSSPPVPTAVAGAAAAAEMVVTAPTTPPTATVPPLAEADKVGARETRASTSPERDELKSEGDADDNSDSDDKGEADIGGDDDDANGKDDSDVSVGGGDGDSAEEKPSSHWACRSCSTFNSSSRLFCSSCATPFEKKGGQDGKSDWWCCKQCSRFNNYYQDGTKCRLCSAPEGAGGEEDEEEQDEDDGGDDGIRDNDEEEEEMEDEIISVGGGELMSSMTMAAGSVERLAPPLPPA